MTGSSESLVIDGVPYVLVHEVASAKGVDKMHLLAYLSSQRLQPFYLQSDTEAQSYWVDGPVRLASTPDERLLVRKQDADVIPPATDESVQKAVRELLRAFVETEAARDHLCDTPLRWNVGSAEHLQSLTARKRVAGANADLRKAERVLHLLLSAVATLRPVQIAIYQYLSASIAANSATWNKEASNFEWHQLQGSDVDQSAAIAKCKRAAAADLAALQLLTEVSKDLLGVVREYNYPENLAFARVLVTKDAVETAVQASWQSGVVSAGARQTLSEQVERAKGDARDAWTLFKAIVASSASAEENHAQSIRMQAYSAEAARELRLRN